MASVNLKRHMLLQLFQVNMSLVFLFKIKSVISILKSTLLSYNSYIMSLVTSIVH